MAGRVRFAAAVAVLAAALALPTASQSAPRFSLPIFVDKELAGGEPFSIAVPKHHRIVYTSHEGTTHLYRPGFFSPLPFGFNYRNQVNIWTSDDQGASWQRTGVAGFSADPTKSSGFSDPDLTMDASGRVYNVGINLVNDSIFSSDDGGKTWDRGNPNCHNGDRPWIAGGKANEVFMGTNTLENELSHQVFRSTDGGNTCSSEGIPDQGTIGEESYVGDGKLFYDQERLIEPVVFSKPSDDPSADPVISAVGVGVWKPGDSQFKPTKIADTSLYSHWPALAIDDDHNVYMVWDDNPGNANEESECGHQAPLANSVKLAVSRDFGKTWSKPITVAHPSKARVLWPWVTAGSAGRVSVVWYQTSRVVDPDCQESDISIYEAVSRNATSSDPSFAVANAARRPIHESSVCEGGTTCVVVQKDRRLGDFFTNAVDERGCVTVSSGDTTQTDPISGQPFAISLPIYLRQTSGAKLRGSGVCTASRLPSSEEGLGQCRDRRAPVSHLRRRNVRRSRRAIRMRGTSSDRGCRATKTARARRGRVQTVFVSIAKVRGRHRCRFLNRKGRLQRARNCRRPTLLRARGTRRWRFRIRARLPRGTYRAVARGVDASENKERPAKPRNQVRFRIR
jgi:hypothetical protein